PVREEADGGGRGTYQDTSGAATSACWEGPGSTFDTSPPRAWTSRTRLEEMWAREDSVSRKTVSISARGRLMRAMGSSYERSSGGRGPRTNAAAPIPGQKSTR